MNLQLRLERLGVGKAQTPRADLQLVLDACQHVRLLFVDDLQSMFDGPQQNVRA